MFSAVSQADLKIVIDAMDERKVNTGEYVIREGEDGDCLYIIESGKYKCTKIFKGQT